MAHELSTLAFRAGTDDFEAHSILLLLTRQDRADPPHRGCIAA